MLWLDERWYDALERHLHGESLTEKMNDILAKDGLFDGEDGRVSFVKELILK